MASVRDYDELLCIICMDKIRDPVMSRNCGHSYCQKCICRQLKEKESESCPICSKSLSSKDLVDNIHLKNFLNLRQFHVSLRQCSKCHRDGICSFHQLLRNENSFEDDELLKLDCFEKTLKDTPESVPTYDLIKKELEADKLACKKELIVLQKAADDLNIKLSDEEDLDDGWLFAIR